MFHVKRFSFNGYYTTFLHFGQEPCILREILSLGDESMEAYAHCTLCPRACGADRISGARGFCGMPAHPVAARAAVHLWEEPAIAGDFGTGAIFFSGCTLGCAFCQNETISHGGVGRPVSTERLREIFLRLIDEGVSSISLITATQFVPSILPALTPKLPVPIVWNSGGYETVETLRLLDGLVDVYLPDFKFSDPALARQLSAAEDYPAVAAAAIREMVRQTGPGRLRRRSHDPRYADPASDPARLPRQHVRRSGYHRGGVFSWQHPRIPDAPVHARGRVAKTPPFDRTVTDVEYAGALSYMQLLGLNQGYLQEAVPAGAQYVPPFDFSGL